MSDRLASGATNNARADFLLELLSEEIPARMQAKARNDLARMMAEALASAGLSHDGITTYSTPRRLALIAKGLPAATEAVSEEIKGPKTAAPGQALDGFLRKTGLTQDQLQDRDGTWFAVIDRASRATTDVLAEAVATIVRDFQWPKSMRWGAASASTASLRWVRPLHSIVALLGETIVPVDIEGVTGASSGKVGTGFPSDGATNINAGAATLGHRFHHPGPITIGGAHDYVQKLRACHVLVDQAEREAIIRAGALEAAEKAGFVLVEDEGLVVENAGLTEWPVPLLGSFDADYLDVPPEVIQLTARTNQKYFVMRDGEGRLAPNFVCVANIDANDGGAAIIAGNERVLAARLSDARFFWKNDLDVKLEVQAKKLEQIVFHEKLGTVADKVVRVAKLAEWLVTESVVKGCTAADVKRAAELCKADLVTGMVGEFPELQGVIGGHLARAQGEPDAIADAIRDHYKPVGQGDEVPTAPVTVAVSLADKLDTLVGFFAIKEKPTGSKDPFALRRAMLGNIEIITQNRLRRGFREIVRESYRVLANQICENRHVISQDVDNLSFNSPILRGEAAYLEIGKELVILNDDPPISQLDSSVNGRSVWNAHDLGRRGVVDFEMLGFVDTLNEVTKFCFDRLRDREKRSGRRPDLVSAALPINRIDPLAELGLGNHAVKVANTTSNDDIVRLLDLGASLESLIGSSAGSNLLAGYKRAANILKKETWDAGAASDADVLPDEAALAAALEVAGPTATAAVEAENFTAAMSALASLRAPIDAFFDKVIVNDPDAGVRARRLNLLARFRDAVHAVADFSKIEG